MGDSAGVQVVETLDVRGHGCYCEFC